MKKSAIGVLCAGALAIAGALATSYYMGVRIHAEFEQAALTWNTEGAMRVRLLDYQRGITSSHAISLWSFSTEDDNYDIAVTHNIIHGPWAWGKAAQITSQFQLPPNTEPQLEKALQGQPPLQWRITADWQGATTHDLQSPAFTAHFEDQSVLTWGGLQAYWQLSAQRNAAQGFVHMPHMRTEVVEGNQMALEGTKLTFDAQIAQDHLFWQGPIQLQIAELKLYEPHTETYIRVQQWHIDSHTRLEGELANLQLQSRIGSLQLPDWDARNLMLSMRMDHVHADWLNQWMQWVQYEGSEEEHVLGMWQALPKLLTAKPVLTVEQLSAETQNGLAQFSAKLSYVGTEPQAFDPANDLQAMMHAQLPKPMLIHILNAKVHQDYLELLDQLSQELETDDLQAAIEDGVSKRLKALLNLGAIKDTGDHYTTEVEFKQGHFTLNGQPTELHNLLQLGGAI